MKIKRWVIYVVAVIAVIGNVVTVGVMLKERIEDRRMSAEAALEPDKSLLYYRNAATLAKDIENVAVEYYPGRNGDYLLEGVLDGYETEGTVMVPGTVSGSRFARFLEEVSWIKWSAPEDELSKNESVVFRIDDGYFITVYRDMRKAKVVCNSDARYYRMNIGDYSKVLAMLAGTASYRDVIDYEAEELFNYTYQEACAKSKGVEPDLIGTWNSLRSRGLKDNWDAPIYKISTEAELDRVRETLAESLNLEHGEGGLKAFNVAAEKYTMDYFTENSLILCFMYTDGVHYGISSKDMVTIQRNRLEICLDNKGVIEDREYTDEYAFFTFVEVKDKYLEDVRDYLAYRIMVK